MTDKIQLCLRLPEEKISELKEEAKKQKRSVNNLLEVIIDEYLEKQKQNWYFDISSVLIIIKAKPSEIPNYELRITN